MSDAWRGTAVTNARKYWAQMLPAPCGHCGQTVNIGDDFVVGHIKPRNLFPHLMMNRGNQRVEHRSCSQSSSTREVQVAAATKALMSQGMNIDDAYDLALQSVSASVFPLNSPVPKSAHLPVFHTQATQGPAEPSESRSALSWDNFTSTAPAWLLEALGPAPGNAAPPLYMTPVHPESVGTYGPEAEEWIRETQGVELRWWQRLALYRQLEYRLDGSLCWRTIIETTPRQSGKSIRLRSLASWRVMQEGLFGEKQFVLHVASKAKVAREIQAPAWGWFEAQGWKVYTGLGREAIGVEGDNRWVCHASGDTYGYSASLGMIDEGWNIDPSVVHVGLIPTSVERASSQIHITSTGHPTPTALMPEYINACLAADDGWTLLLYWGAPQDADISDPAVWRAASPHWSEAREQMIRQDWEAGRLESLRTQWLNIWPLSGTAKPPRGNSIIDREEWESLTVDLPIGSPGAIAVESWFNSGVSVVRAWNTGDVVTVDSSDFPDVASAAAYIRSTGYTGRVRVGASVAEDPAWKGIRVDKATGRTGAAVEELSRLLTQGLIAHSGSESLSEQVLGIRTLPSPEGLRMASSARADAVKAAVWSIGATRKPVSNAPRRFISV